VRPAFLVIDAPVVGLPNIAKILKKAQTEHLFAIGPIEKFDVGVLIGFSLLDVLRVIPAVSAHVTKVGAEKLRSPALVHALQPRVAVMNNGTRKGGEPDSFRVLYDSPGLEDLWQLHWSYNVGLENSPATFVANIEDNATIAGVLVPQPGAARGAGGAGFGGAAHSPAYLIKVSAHQDGGFSVTNTRNGFTKTYRPRP
jgi:hypothetical protein